MSQPKVSTSEMSKTVFQPTRWYVSVEFVTEDCEFVQIARHDCRDKHQACTLLTELRALLADMAALLPGVTATGYEWAEAQTVPMRETFAEALETSTLSEEDKLYWRGEIAQGNTFEKE